MTADRRQRLRAHLPALMLLLDGSCADAEIAAAVDGGVNMLQARAPEASTVRLADLASDARAIAAGRALVLVNGDVDAALWADADGVHLPEAMWPSRLASVRAAVGDAMLVSCAVHGVEAAARADAEGADMVVAGTVFPSASHPGGATIGIDGLAEICAAVRVPVIAIGGVTAANAGEVMQAGASGAAVIGAIRGAPDARTAAKALRTAIDAGFRRRNAH